MRQPRWLRTTDSAARVWRIVAVVLLAVVLPAAMVIAVPGNGAGSRSAQAAPARPNIILIVTDDQRWDYLQYMPIVQERLGGRGTTFTHASVVTPTCCPGRVGILTGKYTHRHQIWHNGAPQGGAIKFHSPENGGEQQTVATMLQGAGYSTFMVGKYLNEYKLITPPYRPPGWSDWHGHTKGHLYLGYDLYEQSGDQPGTTTHFNRVQANYSTDVFRDRAVTFIQNTPGPFFMYVAPNAPHGDYGGPPIVAARHQGTCADVPLTNPPSFNEADVSDKPAWIRRYDPVDPVAIETYRRAKICALKAVDEAVGAMLDALGPQRLANTLVIFTSDNGYTLGEHRYTSKNCLYEECIRVPLVISFPRYGTTPRTESRLVQNIDLLPTILQVAGVPQPAGLNGLSLVPLLRGQQVAWRTAVLIEYYNNHAVTGVPEEQRYDAAIRTATAKYGKLGIGDEEFYDLTIDPYEETNRINDPAYQTTIAGCAPDSPKCRQGDRRTALGQTKGVPVYRCRSNPARAPRRTRVARRSIPPRSPSSKASS